jgi:hypothetical protein
VGARLKVGDEGVGKNDAWATYSADPALGLVYIPVGMPLMDEYGGHRPGDNLYGNSLVALDARTGKRKWHFQMVHHDIWDYDTPQAPNLYDAVIDGKPRKVIAQTTKQGWIYVRPRDGEPIWPIVETPVLASDVPGERASPTQPIPTKPPRTRSRDCSRATHRLHPRHSRQRARWRSVPHGAVLHPRRARRWLGPWAQVLVVRPGRLGRREHRRRGAVDPETGMMYVGRAERPQHHLAAEGPLLRVPLQLTARQLRPPRRPPAAAGLQPPDLQRWWLRRRAPAPPARRRVDRSSPRSSAASPRTT